MVHGMQLVLGEYFLNEWAEEVRKVRIQKYGSHLLLTNYWKESSPGQRLS